MHLQPSLFQLSERAWTQGFALDKQCRLSVPPYIVLIWYTDMGSRSCQQSKLFRIIPRLQLTCSPYQYCTLALVGPGLQHRPATALLWSSWPGLWQHRDGMQLSKISNCHFKIILTALTFWCLHPTIVNWTNKSYRLKIKEKVEHSMCEWLIWWLNCISELLIRINTAWTIIGFQAGKKLAQE